jgi:hypothetical protein
MPDGASALVPKLELDGVSDLRTERPLEQMESETESGRDSAGAHHVTVVDHASRHHHGPRHPRETMPR